MTSGTGRVNQYGDKRAIDGYYLYYVIIKVGQMGDSPNAKVCELKMQGIATVIIKAEERSDGSQVCELLIHIDRHCLYYVIIEVRQMGESPQCQACELKMQGIATVIIKAEERSDGSQVCELQ